MGRRLELRPTRRCVGVTDTEWVEAHRANTLFDAHVDDPEFGYRFHQTRNKT